MNNELSIKDGISGYSGKVKLSLVKDGITYKEVMVHNTGTSEFFRYTLSCVCGQPDHNMRPGYLYLYNYSEVEGQEIEEQLINFGILYDGEVTIATGNDSSNPSASLTYRFMVPSTLIRGKTINRLKLKSLSKKNGDYLTYAILESIQPIKVESDTNLEVRWTLILENQIKEE